MFKMELRTDYVPIVLKECCKKCKEIEKLAYLHMRNCEGNHKLIYMRIGEKSN